MPVTVRNYEAMVIIKSIMTEDMINAVIEKLANVLTSGGANLKETARWGRRKLAYEIQKQSEGFYVIFYFTLEVGKDVLPAFERTCRYDENVIRHMVVNVPTRKRGQEIAQLVPSPGWMSEYTFQPRPYTPRRPRVPRDADQMAPPPAAEGAPAEAAPVAAAAEPAPAPAPEA